jgi:hypothetical protein
MVPEKLNNVTDMFDPRFCLRITPRFLPATSEYIDLERWHAMAGYSCDKLRVTSSDGELVLKALLDAHEWV